MVSTGWPWGLRGSSKMGFHGDGSQGGQAARGSCPYLRWWSFFWVECRWAACWTTNELVSREARLAAAKRSLDFVYRPETWLTLVRAPRSHHRFVAQIPGADLLMTKIHMQDPILLGRSQGDQLPDQPTADKALAAADLDRSLGADFEDAIAGCIFDGRQGFGKGAGADPVAAGRGRHSECVMRTHGVVAGAPAINRLLCARQIGKDLMERQFGPDRGMQPFDLALGLGMIGTAMDDLNPEANQPGLQGRDSPGATGAPGRAVVGQQRQGQSVLLEGLLQMGLDRPSAFIGARPGAQRVAGMVIEQGQQMHPVSGGAQRQMPHEIHLPQLVRRRSLEELRPLPLGGGVGGNQSMPMQDVGNGARRWQRGDALRLEQPLQLASPPGRILCPQRHHPGFGLRRGLGRRLPGAARAILRPVTIGAVGPLPPLVAGRWGDAKAPAQRPKRNGALVRYSHEFSTLLLHGLCLPDHVRPPLGVPQ